MAEYSNAEVHEVYALRERRQRVNQSRARFEELANSVKRELSLICAHCAQVERNRWQELQSCETDPERDCTLLRQRHYTAAQVRVTVDRVAGELLGLIAVRRRRVDERAAIAADWLSRLANHLEGIGPPPDDIGTSSAVSSGGSSGSAPTPGSSQSSAAILGGSPFGRDLERVALSTVALPTDLFETEPAKGGATKEDMIWAARTFRDTIVPHIMRGGTRDELREMDRASGNQLGFRRLEGAWEVYLGDSAPKVDCFPDGRVDVTNGRHRILAAQVAGLTWLPMRVSHVSGAGNG